MESYTKQVLWEAEDKIAKTVHVLGSLSNRSREAAGGVDLKGMGEQEKKEDKIIGFLYEVDATLDILCDYLEEVANAVREQRQRGEAQKAA